MAHCLDVNPARHVRRVQVAQRGHGNYSGNAPLARVGSRRKRGRNNQDVCMYRTAQVHMCTPPHQPGHFASCRAPESAWEKEGVPRWRAAAGASWWRWAGWTRSANESRRASMDSGRPRVARRSVGGGSGSPPLEPEGPRPTPLRQRPQVKREAAAGRAVARDRQ